MARGRSLYESIYITLSSDEDISQSSDESFMSMHDKEVPIDEFFKQHYPRLSKVPDEEEKEEEQPVTSSVVFDMPLDMYNVTKTLNLRNKLVRAALTRLYDLRTTGVPKSAKQRKKFRFIDPDILIARLLKRETFEYVRKFALQLLQKEIVNKLTLAIRLNECAQRDLSQGKLDIPHGMFNWSLDDFINRRKQNILWIDLLFLQRRDKCIELEKIKIDYYELLRFVTLIFKGLMNENDKNFDVNEDVLKPIHEAYKLIEYSEKLEIELIHNKAFYKTTFEKNLDLSWTKTSKERFLYNNLEKALTNYEVFYPLEMRYQVRYYESITVQSEFKAEKIHEEYQKKINDCFELLQRETLRNQCMTTANFTEIETYKKLFNKYMDRYNTEFENIENSIQYNRMQLDKLKEHRQFLENEIVRFHEAIKTRLAKEEYERVHPPIISVHKKKKKRK